MIRIRAPSNFRATCRAVAQQQQLQYQHYQQRHNTPAAAVRGTRAHQPKNVVAAAAASSAGEYHRHCRRCLPQKPGLMKVSCRFLASASGGSSSGSSNSGARNRSYLERWAGIRGRVASGTEAATAAASASLSSPLRKAGSTPSVSVFGRTYLLSTIRLPPFPANSSPLPPGVMVNPSRSGQATRVNGSGGEGGEGGGGAVNKREEKEGEEEERRVFDWMRGALRGSGALGATGFFPGAGSPVVLDLGAVAQDGSPHGRPAGRAALAGAARAVRAAGLVPVGVCNTSHDVLELASEQGLPEIMMVQTRPRSSQQSSPTLTAATLRAQAPQVLPSSERSSSERYSEVPSSSSERSSAERSFSDFSSSSESSSSKVSSSAERSASKLGSSTVSQPTVTERTFEYAEQHVPVGVSGAVVVSKGDGGAMGARDDGLDGASTEGKQGEDRETMVYEGSVRSGQQVYAEGTSLVVIGAVSSGGEVMADGDIHVYGTLRGRALAGLSGSKSAKIFATRFDAELVGVSDSFTTCDDPDSLPGLVVEAPTNVCLRQNKLVFQSFDLSSTHQP